MIIVMLASRKEGNPNSDLPSTLNSLAQNVGYAENYQVRIKRDLDDVERDHPEYFLGQYTQTRYLNSERLRGYADLHVAYGDLYTLTSGVGSLYWILADDVSVEAQQWDERLIALKDTYLDRMFVCNFHTADFASMSERDAIEAPDTFPVWSRKWIATQGFGCTFNTDAFTALVCHKLFHRGVDRRIHVPWLKVNRKICDADVAGSTRWNNERAEAMEILMGSEGQRMAIEAADRIEKQILKVAA